METTSENIIKAYNIARETGADSTCKVLEALYPDVDFNPKDNRPVTERIKTFDDACEALGEEHRLVQAYRAVEGMTALGADLYAYLKLRIITAALNEGWEPQFTEDEWRYYPWFYLWSAEELADKDDEWKRDRCLRSCENHRVLFGGSARLSVRLRASPLRTRFAPPRIRMRTSALAFAINPRSWPCIRASNLSTFGWTSTSSANKYQPP